MKKGKIAAAACLVLAGTLTLGNFVFAGGKMSFLPAGVPTVKVEADNSAGDSAADGIAVAPSDKARGERGWVMRSRIGGLDIDVGAIAEEALGMTANEILDALKANGGDVAALLEENNALEKAKAIIADKIAAAVAAGSVTQEQADNILADVDVLFGKAEGLARSIPFGGGHGFKGFDGIELPEGFDLAGLDLEGLDSLGGFEDIFGGRVAKGAFNNAFANIDVNAIARDVLGLTEDDYNAALKEANGDLRGLLESKGAIDAVKAKVAEAVIANAGDIADSLIDGSSRMGGGRLFKGPERFFKGGGEIGIPERPPAASSTTGDSL